MKLLAALIATTFLLTAFAGDRHCRTERLRTYAEQIATLNPEIDFKLIDYDFFEGGGFISGYQYEVEPAYTKGLYSRKDKWRISAQAIPGDKLELSDSLDLSLSGGLRNLNEATFIRFMKDPCQAMLAAPYSPRRIPLKSKVALGTQFNQGDYFLFRGSVGFVVSAEILQMISSGFWGIGFSGSYLMEGFYQLHIVRLDETHIRLKVLAHRGNELNVSMGLGYENEFNIFSIDQLNGQLEKLVNTKPIKVTADLTKSKVFLVDYILDLTDSEVAVAYESIVRKARKYRNLDLTAPFKNNTDLETSLLLDLSPLEDLYRNDRDAGSIERIRRNLKTSSEQNSYGFGVSLGNKIIGMKFQGSIDTSLMSIRQDDDGLERYLLKTWGKGWEGRFLYSLSKASREDTLSTLFRADENFQNLTPVTVIKSLSQKKNNFSYSDFEALKLDLRKSLPLEIYSQIDWLQWPQQKRQKYTNFGLRYELLMSPESILEAPMLSHPEIVRRYRAHLKSKGLGPSDFFFRLSDDVNEQDFARELSSLAFLLEKALDQARPLRERLDYITSLRSNRIFLQTGISFLMSLNLARMSTLYHFDLNVSSNEAQIDFTYGEAQTSGLYKKILTIKAALDDDGLDLIREAESISTDNLSWQDTAAAPRSSHP